MTSVIERLLLLRDKYKVKYQYELNSILYRDQ